MDFTKVDIRETLAEMNGQRERMGMSYQAVADACDVSQTTVIRIFRGEVQPSFELMQKIAASIRYKPQKEEIVPAGYNQEAFIEYLKHQLLSERENHERQTLQQEAQYNRLRRQDRRTIFWLCLILGALVFAFIVWLIIDVTHPTVGWFQRDIAYQNAGLLGNLFSGAKESLL